MLIISLDIDPQHGKYLDTKPLHEAGYDSLLTAQILIKLSAQLNTDPGEAKKTEGSNIQAFSTVYRKAMEEITSTSGKTKVGSQRDDDSTGSLVEFSPGRNRASSCTVLPKKYPSQRPVDWTEPTEFDRIRSAFAHRTRFDLLTDQTEEVLSFPPKENGDEGSASTTAEESLLSFPEDISVEQKVAAGELIPRFSSKFWSVYGNKLRVFGTEEGVCMLNPRIR